MKRVSEAGDMNKVFVKYSKLPASGDICFALIRDEQSEEFRVIRNGHCHLVHDPSKRHAVRGVHKFRIVQHWDFCSPGEREHNRVDNLPLPSILGLVDVNGVRHRSEPLSYRLLDRLIAERDVLFRLRCANHVLIAVFQEEILEPLRTKMIQRYVRRRKQKK